MLTLPPSTSNNNLVLTNAEKHLTLYKGMCSAIGVCHRVDECKDIDKSVALAAYYKQIKDDETVRKFNEVRLRAWRRIGKLFAAVDVSKCETQTAKIKTIRGAFDNVAMAGINDNRMREILTLMELSDKDFEHALSHELTGSIANLLQHTPQHQAWVRKNQETYQASPPRTLIQIGPNSQGTIDLENFVELAQASEAAMKEVGITLDRKDRTRMKQVVFLIKEEVHGVMRQAAFDQKITMQEILRRGLKMWLIANDYKFPDE
jgi:hypothetical protein